jgi:hypothetical protein
MRTTLPNPATSTTGDTHDSMIQIERPFKGRLVIRQLGEVIGVVLGDAAIGWSARDALMHTIGSDKYLSEQAAIDAVLMTQA